MRNGSAQALEWLWSGKQMAELRRSARWETINIAELEQRARFWADASARIRGSSSIGDRRHAGAVACELYREALYWALRAQEVRRSRDSVSSLPGDRDAGPSELERLWSSSLAAGGPFSELPSELIEGVSRDFVRGTFVEFSELSLDEQRCASERLGRALEACLTDGARTREQIDALWVRRFVRWGALAVAFGLLLASGSGVRNWYEQRLDLAEGRPWRVSSDFETGGCRSPEQRCAAGRDYFFHTHDEDQPWVELDLGAPRSIARVIVTNRLDCCEDRAVPLTIETSLDQQTFREIARRDRVFAKWIATVEPVPARYVRIRAARRTMLHFSSVRVLPP